MNVDLIGKLCVHVLEKDCVEPDAIAIALINRTPLRSTC